MKKMLPLFFFPVYLCLPFGAIGYESEGEPVRITGPTVIDQPGHYVLEEDLADNSAGVFIEIRASDVLLDGQGNRITGSGTEDTTAVLANEDAALSSVTIENLVVENWETGFDLSNLTNATIENNAARQCHSSGFEISSFPESGNSTFTGNLAIDGGWGFRISSLHDSSLAGNTARNNAQAGFRFSFCNDNTVTGNHSKENAGDGFWFSRSQGHTLTANTAEGNDRHGLTVPLDSHFVLRENVMIENRFNLNLTPATGTSPINLDLDDSNTVNQAPVLYIQHETDVVVDPAAEIGYLGIAGSTGVVVEDIDLHEPNAHGILIFNSEDCVLENLDVQNSEYGVSLESSKDVKMRNVQMTGNSYNLNITGLFRHDIDTTNLAGGKPVFYLRDTEGITIDQDDNPGYIGIVDSQDITIDDVTLSRNGQGMLIVRSSSIAMSSVIVTDSGTGIHLESVEHSIVDDFRISRCTSGPGVILLHSDNNHFTEGVMEDIMRNPGLHLEEAHDNLIRDVSVDVISSPAAIELRNANKNRIEDSVFTHPFAALVLRRSTENTFRGNGIYGRIWLVSDVLNQTSRNLFYNNWIEGVAGSFVRMFGSVRHAENFWNIEPKPGLNIAGGTVIAGNFWALPDGSGPSQTCENQTDGLCDEPFLIHQNNVDETPLVIPDFNTTVISEATVIDEPGYYLIDRDWVDIEADTFIKVESSSVTVDGLGHTISGDGTAAVDVNADDGFEDIKVRNFELNGWSDGIRLENVSNSLVEHNRISGTERALVVRNSGNNEVVTNRFVENGVGISLDAPSSGNTFYNNEFFEDYPVDAPAESSSNKWHVEPRNETNIAGGPLVAGNFWGTPAGNGRSERCFEVVEGFCTAERQLVTGETDPYPLVRGFALEVPPGMHGKPKAPVTLAEPGYYYLTEDSIHEWPEETLLFRIESSNVLFDGRGHRIELILGTGGSTDVTPVRAESPGEASLENIRVRNIGLDNWVNGIEFARVSGGKISGIESPLPPGVPHSNPPFFHLDGCRDITVADNFVGHAGRPVIAVEQSQNIAVTWNEFDVNGGDTILHAAESSAVEIANNLFHRGGVDLHQLEDSIIEGNALNMSLNLAEGHGNRISDNTVDNGQISLHGSNENRIENNFVRAANDGLVLSESAGNLVTQNRVEVTDASAAVFIGGAGSGSNRLFDNFFQSAQGARTGIAVGENEWNIQPRPGRNIINGPYIAGNYWADEGGNGFSAGCDATADRLCPEAFAIDERNVDQYPLADPIPGDYASWLDEHLSDEEREQDDLAAASADPGNFGIPNALRYVFALDPKQPGRHRLPSPGLVQDDETSRRFLSLTFSRRLDAPDTDLVFQKSTDLLTWKTTDAVSVEESVIEDNVETLTIRLDVPVSANEEHFLRVDARIDSSD